MAWAKLDDKFHSHPSTWTVGLEGNGLFCRAISYCADQLTDGFVPEAWVYAQLPGTRRHQDPRGLIQKLEDAGLWERIEDGWFIKDYLNYNPSRDEEMARRAEISQKRSEAGRRGAASRWRNHEKVDATERQRARNVANTAQKTGELAAQPCESCGSEVNVEKHHDDYSDALNVRWLCRKCHGKLHGKSHSKNEAA